jgi:hypothetical protein
MSTQFKQRSYPEDPPALIHLKSSTIKDRMPREPKTKTPIRKKRNFIRKMKFILRPIRLLYNNSFVMNNCYLIWLAILSNSVTTFQLTFISTWFLTNYSQSSWFLCTYSICIVFWIRKQESFSWLLCWYVSLLGLVKWSRFQSSINKKPAEERIVGSTFDCAFVRKPKCRKLFTL